MGRPPKQKEYGDNLSINLGCGNKKTPGFINIDRKGSDLDLNLEDAKLPFKDGSVVFMQADHVLEHIHNLLPLMNEINRVMANNGEVRIRVPIFPTEQAFQDPTHVRFFTRATMLYFVAGEHLFEEVGRGYDILPFSRIIQHTEGFELVARMWK